MKDRRYALRGVPEFVDVRRNGGDASQLGNPMEPTSRTETLNEGQHESTHARIDVAIGIDGRSDRRDRLNVVLHTMRILREPSRPRWPCSH